MEICNEIAYSSLGGIHTFTYPTGAFPIYDPACFASVTVDRYYNGVSLVTSMAFTVTFSANSFTVNYPAGLGNGVIKDPYAFLFTITLTNG